jgi:hypothetical protein
MPVKHLFTSGVADGADATLVQPGDWNDFHVAPYASGAFTLATGQGAMHVDTLEVTTTLTVTLEGTSTLRIL